MKLLLCKNISKLGIVGDIVDVSPGYARNYLVPQGLATEPTETNIRALAKARRQAELERGRQRADLVELAERLNEVEVTVPARANEQGHLYGSVGHREISAALMDEGYPITPEQVLLSEPIRQLDNVAVDLRLTEDLHSSIKVWVVRDRSEEETEDETATSEESEEARAGKEAGTDDDGTSE
jgi:large subunit ribosomal protein L9